MKLKARNEIIWCRKAWNIKLSVVEKVKCIYWRTERAVRPLTTPPPAVFISPIHR
jgi:hypothetical protein